ncbi:3-dehydroquinate synthase [bacterium]|nr:3-dehydroquinate synthase [candidate division CSSED10-310 bacterium]
MRQSDGLDHGAEWIVPVELPGRRYDIVIGHGAPTGLTLRGLLHGRRAAVVIDQAVARLQPGRCAQIIDQCATADTILLPPGERTKSLIWAGKVYSRFLKHDMDRSSLVIALGGGVVGDLAGFAAATFMRGIDYCQVPTTLLAMVDASVGGKVAVNIREGKNLVGCFHQPRAVLIDPGFLATLPPRHIRSGLGEVFKTALLAGEEVLAEVERISPRTVRHSPDQWCRLIALCCEYKAGIVMEDETELGRRRLLNLGHTIGHGLELLHGYRRLSHGEAVAIGLLGACLLADARGLLAEKVLWRLESLLRRWRMLPRRELVPSCDALLPALRHDKKKLHGTLHWVLPHGLGDARIHLDVNERELRSMLARMAQWCDNRPGGSA